jgi:hypothetical protein
MSVELLQRGTLHSVTGGLREAVRFPRILAAASYGSGTCFGIPAPVPCSDCGIESDGGPGPATAARPARTNAVGRGARPSDRSAEVALARAKLTCEVCGVLLQASRSSRRFCSDRCRQRHHRLTAPVPPV